MLNRVLPIFLATSAFSCGKHLADTSKGKGVLDPSSGVAVLGDSYDTQSEEFKALCVQPRSAEAKYIFGGQQRAELNFARSMSYDDLKSMLEVQVKGKLALEAFNASGSTRFMAAAASSELSTSLIYSAVIKGKSARINDPVLTGTGRAAAATLDKKRIREVCGDEYVDTADLGAQLLFNLKFDFANADVKSEFEADIDLDFVDLFQVNGAAKVAFEKYKKNVRITISALQVGGDVTQLPTIFKVTQNSVPIIDCDFENQQACSQALRDITAYASETFPKQLEDLSYDPGRPMSAAVLAYRTKPYTAGGNDLGGLVPDPSDVLAANIIAVRKELIDLYEIQNRDRQRVLQVIKMRLDAEESAFFMGQLGLIGRNIKKIIDAAEACYKDINKCIRETADLKLETYDGNRLTKTRRFLDFCDQQKRSQSIEDTISAVRKWIGSTADDDCDDVNADLLQQVGMELTAVRDLRPLFGLKNLQTLSVTNGSMTNISTLSSLQNLKKLNLRKNNISSLGALSSLHQLIELDLAHNRLVDLEPLRNLTGLRVLKLFSERNKVLDFEPVEKLPNLNLLYTTPESICTSERDYAFKKGLIPAELYETYKAIDFAPIYKTPTVRESGIDDWINCFFVVTYY